MTTTPEDDRPALHEQLSRIAMELHGVGLETTIERISEATQVALLADGAGIMVLRAGGRIETATSTDDQIAKAHRLQVDLGEGPCLHVAAEGGVQRVDDTRSDTRWPRWAEAAADLGYRSVLSVAMTTGDRRYGSLNAYAEEAGRFEDSDEAVGVVLARHATVALASATDIAGLRRAVDGRQVIGTAIGILMERYELDPHRAFEVLTRYSQQHNVKLHAVAKELVEHGVLPQD